MDSFLHGVEVIEIDTGPRPIQTVRSAVIGLIGTAPRADVEAFPLNTPILLAGSRREAAKLLANTGDDDGTLPSALDAIFDQVGALVVVVRVEHGADASLTLPNVIGGVNAQTGHYEGVHAFLGAESQVGVAPRILIAPGFTGEYKIDTGNPVIAELLPIAERLRAVVLADGPNKTDADAITAAALHGSARLYMIDPFATRLNWNGAVETAYPSALGAGIIARTDNELGFWWSPSNKPVNGIIGTDRPVDFALGDASARANVLNEQGVATIIRQDGFRLWGNRSTTDDTQWLFLSTRRTADMINDALLRAHLWAVDQNITKTYIEQVAASVNAYLRHLVSLGAIIGGRCYADPELNTPDSIALGKVYFDFDFTPPYPAEHITFRSHLTNDYLTEIV